MIKKFIKKVKTRLNWGINDLLFAVKLLYHSLGKSSIDNSYSIGVTTFLNRYKIFFKPLIKRLVYLFPDTKIIIAVNGHVQKNEQMNYLEEISNYTSKFKNVNLIKFIEPQGLSKLWNEIIKMSKTEKVILLNDDLKVTLNFRKEIENSGTLNYDIAVFNNSWGHFIISKNIINKVGWFDENLLEIGGEDDDYCARLAIANINSEHIEIKSIANFSKPLKSNSYGKDMTGKNRYSEYNSNYLLNEKWVTSNEPFEGAVYVPNRNLKYWKLRE